MHLLKQRPKTTPLRLLREQDPHRRRRAEVVGERALHQAVERRDGAHHEGFGAADLVDQNCEQLARLRGAALVGRGQELDL